ncbi:HD-GYP domain-containing protein [Bacillus tuaregi]|uniref:HD-GYP domain-containing protein n=1 Tax=Bacillus tuaregi TaxID=1816695 RepID=UPI000B05AFD1|nr:HD-GYP domain-containing protein [Bacillus tuaregi]
MKSGDNVRDLCTKWILNNPVNFRYAFIMLLIIGISLNGFILVENDHFYFLYILSAIYLGIGFYNQSFWFIFSLTLLIVLSRTFFIPELLPFSAKEFFIHLFTYSVISFKSAELMKNVQNVKGESLELTMSLANALDSRDPYTMHHSENVAKYAVAIAKKMKLSEDKCEAIRIGSLLHDIGKIGIPEHILNKPGRLTNVEFNEIKLHPNIGYRMVKHVESFKRNGVIEIVLYHHERYDGNGYPEGLKGKDIPLAARIVAIADSFDAMTSKRVYSNQMEIDIALDEIRKNRGTQFDPDIADVFFSLFEKEKNTIKCKVS